MPNSVRSFQLLLRLQRGHCHCKNITRSFVATSSPINNSPLSSCRKRRICELAPPIVETELGVSPNLSSGMTPQMKVQLQMKTPPLKNSLGSKRLRCGSLEPNVLCLPNHRVSQEEVL